MIHLAVHGHFYQPPRENPWTEEVPVEPSAAPYHDWNERITAEAYRPNARARIVDDRGRVMAVVNDYELLSFNIGPTLASWLEVHHPDVYGAVLEADRRRGSAIAQAYNHMILPLANERDIRTQVRWGMADFQRRFGRRAAGLWLPETAVNDVVLRILVEEGVGFTILAPTQADRPVEPGRVYRWEHPGGAGHVALVFYDGPLSHDLAFGIGGQPASWFVERAVASAPEGLVVLATDGETFGHHHRFAERAVAYALAVEAPRRGARTGPIAGWLRQHRPTETIGVVESAWSCAHGVGRWSRDCGCSSGGQPGWNQAWRAPLRAALDVLRDHAAEVFERLGREVLRDPWAARDAYIAVVLDPAKRSSFLTKRLRKGADVTQALTLLEAQRHAMLMYTSCGWFFDDIAGLEAVQVLRYAARCMDLLQDAGDDTPIESAVLGVLEHAVSNDPAEETGRDVWARHVEPARVTPARVVAHIALLEVFDGRSPLPAIAGYEVEQFDEDHTYAERGALGLACGRVTLVHCRTQRAHRYVYAAVHFGALDVVGACRPAQDGPGDDEALGALRAAFTDGTRLTQLLRLVSDGFGPGEFDVSAALPDTPDPLLATAARRLADRFGAELERLFTDHRAVFSTLTAAGHPLPDELRVPAQLALARRLEADLVDVGADGDRLALASAQSVVADAMDAGVTLDMPHVRAVAATAVDQLVGRALASGSAADVADAVALLDLARHAGVPVDVAPAQEAVYDRLIGAKGVEPALGSTGAGRRPAANTEALTRLGAALGLAVGHLGIPT
ncbi:MAG TPA: DUF3536 domain-containing protein [Acidimicrobiales bacterium]|nr:DUF3536 domain-containing protein [Acidimicrobiales bacterium]